MRTADQKAELHADKRGLSDDFYGDGHSSFKITDQIMEDLN